MHASEPTSDNYSRRTLPVRRFAGLAALAWSGVIFAMSSLPGSAIPGRFGPLGHFGEYAMLAALVLVTLSGWRQSVDDVLLALALSSAWGITDELHQMFVTMRTPDPVDWLVDTSGAAFGCLVLVAVCWWLRRSGRQ